MKFRYFLTLIASVLVFAGCMQESIDSFESIKLDKTYLTIPEAGGEVELTITATQDWNFVETEMWPRVIAYQKDSNGKEIKDAEGNKVIDESKTVPSWLTLRGEMSGTAGVTKVVFAAEPTNGGREIELSIKAGNNVQYLRVRQGTMLASDATCAEVIAGVDGKSYRVQGVCTSIANDYYGNFYLNDGTGEVYIYGLKDGDGQYNWDSFNIEVGDSVKVEGPRKDYNGTIELVDALFIKVVKSLIKLVEPTDKMVSEEGETFDVKLAYKGKGVFYTVADECSSWVKIEGMTSKSGEPTKLEPNPADTAIVTVTVAPYDEPSSRTGSIEFSSSLDDAKSVITFAFRQGVAEVSVADFLEKEVGDTPYKLTGKIANLNNTTYGNFDLVDATGSIYVYGLTATKVASNDKSFSTLGLREGDIVTIIGTRGEHKEVPQVAGPAYYVSHIGSTDITVKEFLAKEKSKDVWYRLTGKVTGLKAGDYGNFHLVDETGSVYVYGLTEAPVAKNDKSFPTLGVKEGDIVTLVGTRDRYDDAKVPEEKEQVGGPAYYISHEAGDAPAAPGPKSMTIAEAVAQTDSVLVSGTVMALCAKGFILQDESGIAFIYDSGYSQTYVVGDQVKVGGKPGAYNYANQITPNAKYYEKTGSVEVTYPDPVVLNAAKVAEMKDGAGEDKNVGVYNPFYITVEGTVRVSGNYFNLDIDGVETSTAQGSFYQLTDAQKEELTALKDKAVVLTGYFQSISQSGGVPKFFNVIYLTVEEKEAEGGEEPTEKAARNLTFSKATATATLGEEFTAPTLSGETEGVAYTSSNTAVATVDAATGTVTLVAAGETTITASAEETETLQAGTASYTLTVSEAAVTPEGPLVVTVAEFNAAANDETIEYQVSGTISGIYQAYNSQFKNISLYISDETGEMLAFRLTCEGITDPATTLTEGDLITVRGYRTIYNTKPQMAQGCVIVSHTDVVVEEPETPESAVVWTMGSGNQTWAADTHQTYGSGYAATVDGVKVAYYQYNNSNAARTPDSDHIRVYKESALVISAEGKSIKSVTIETTTTEYTSAITVGGNTVSPDGKTITWNGNVNSFEAITAGQIRIKKLTIVAE